MAKPGAIKAVIAAQFDDTGLKKAEKAFGQIGSSLKGILGAAGIGVGLSSIISGLKQATVAAIDDTKSQALLANQLRNTIGASDAQISSVEASIAAMQKQASVADDEIRPAFASLVRATGDVARATSLTSLALDVAAGTGKDLGAVSLALGKAVNGSTTSLLKLVPSIKGAKDPMGELARQFDGAAKAAADNDPIKQLNILFGEMQEQIGMALLPSLQKFSAWMSGPDGTALINGLVRSFESLVAEASLAAEGVGYLGEKTAQLAKDANISIEMNDTATAIAGIGNMAIKSVNPINALIQSLQLLGMLGRLDPTTKFDPTRSGDPSAGRYAAMEAFAKSGALTGTTTTTGKTGGAKKVATDYVKEFATSMADELRKQMARVRLQNKGLSAGLIESIIGSGAGWYKVAQDTLNKSEPALAALQDAWSRTAAGIAEITSKLAEDKRIADEAAAKVAEKAAEALADLKDQLATAQTRLDELTNTLTPAAKTVSEVYTEAKQAYEALTEASANFAKTIPDVVAGIKNMTSLAEPIGQFESQVVSSFGNVESSLKSALDSKLITDQSYRDLSAWAKREMALMQDIARQRDALAQKISLAEAVYNDSKNAILAYGNINGLIKTTAQTITETQTKIVNGITTTLTKSVEQISKTNIVDEYRNILAKTKEFAGNLNALKKMGLNKDLFKQIVDAGVDAGGATAAGIIEGGQQSVTELNSIFAELNTVGDQVAETTTVVMFNNGNDVMGGFINGMKAQAEALANTAKTLAETFAGAFDIALQSALAASIAAAKAALVAAMAALQLEIDAAKAELARIQGEISKVTTPVTAIPVPVLPTPQDNAGDYIVLPSGGAGAIGFRGGTSQVDGGNTINVTVNAGLGTNGAVLGGQIVDLIKKYEKTSGAVFA